MLYYYFLYSNYLKPLLLNRSLKANSILILFNLPMKMATVVSDKERIRFPSSVQFSCSVMSDSLWSHGLQHARPPCPLPTPGVYSNSCPLSWWCHPTISSSVIPVSYCLQYCPASGSFFKWVSSSHQVAKVLVSASTSVLPMNIQDWFSLGWTGWIFLWFKGLSRVFSNTTVQKHQFFSVQLALYSNSHIHTWTLEKP